MSDKLPPSIFPARFQILSGSMLKLLACIAMLIDHTGAIILSHYPPALTELFYINGKGITFYRIVRDIGRCAFRCSFFMTKYSNEFKVKAIKMVLKGNSISHVAKILNIPR